MPLSLLHSFLIYCYLGAITPGPANLCSLSAALRYGKGPALRQWRGLFVGFAIVSLASVLVTYLLGTVMDRYVGILSWVGAAYILWMAFHMLKSSGVSAEDDPAAPTFLRGLLVQLTNVKIMEFLLEPVGGGVVPALHGAGGQSGVAVCGSVAAKALCESPPGGGYRHGRGPGSLRGQSGRFPLNFLRLHKKRTAKAVRFCALYLCAVGEGECNIHGAAEGFRISVNVQL